MNLYKSFCVVEKELFTKAYLPNLFNQPPRALTKFLDLESWAPIRGGHFHHFRQVKYVYFATKQ